MPYWAECPGVVCGLSPGGRYVVQVLFSMFQAAMCMVKGVGWRVNVGGITSCELGVVSCELLEATSK